MMMMMMIRSMLSLDYWQPHQGRRNYFAVVVAASAIAGRRDVWMISKRLQLRRRQRQKTTRRVVAAL
jgi:hypothetical protein